MGSPESHVEAGVWPVASLAEVEALLTAPGQPFEIETLVIDGRPTRVWKNAPPTFRALLETARTHDQTEFVVFEDERITFDAFFKATACLAVWLEEQGVTKGDRVAVAMANLPEWPVAAFAAAALGAIIVPLNAWWSGRELAYGLADSGAKVLLADADRLARIEDHLSDLPDLRLRIVTRAEPLASATHRLEDLIGVPMSWAGLPGTDLPPADLEPDDLATLFYTSGTTGHPKGAVGTQRNGLTNPISAAYSLARSSLRRGEEPAPTAGRRSLVSIPLFHVTAFNAVLLGAIHTGSLLVFTRKWDVIEAFRLIEREKIHGAGGVPTIAWQLLEHPARADYDLSSLDAIGYGGAPAASELCRRIAAEVGAAPNTGWGMTETSATLTHHAGEDYVRRPDSCGPALPVARIRILAQDGVTELPVGEVGELWAYGPQIVKGYWNKPEATAATFVDGWVRTGDLARVDDEGFCYIVDRAKDVIIRGGENIYSAEVEAVLFEHPDVSDVAVVGVPNRVLGEEPVAAIVRGPGSSVTENEIKAWVRERLAAFKAPVQVLFSDRPLPRNASGKVLKAEVRALFQP
jgi:long-chain acyl-CoA synthetase